MTGKKAKADVGFDTLRWAEDSYVGWCPDCEAFTRECTEPDAVDYGCPDCEGTRVMGAMVAMMSGAFTVEGGEARHGEAREDRRKD